MTTPPLSHGPDTDGPDEPTRQLPAQPSVSTAPAAAPRRWWSAVPHHLGRARTSTVVLALLFMGLYTLYLYVRPPDVPTGTVPATDSSVQTPAPSEPAVLPTETAEPTTEAPTTEAPATTTAPPEEETPAGETPTETAEPTSPGVEPTSPADEPASPTAAVPTATGAPAT